MKFSIVLMQSEPADNNGYPIYARVSDKQDRPKKMIGRSWPDDFSDEAGTVLDSHPDYDILGPKIINLKIRAKRIILKGDFVSARAVLQAVLQEDRSAATIQDYFEKWKIDQKRLAAEFEKQGDVKARNRVNGYLNIVENTMVQFGLCAPKIAVADFTAATVLKFKKQCRQFSNATATTALYLRNVRKLYNEACVEFNVKNVKPFENVFRDLKAPPSKARKKYIDMETVRVLESLELGVVLNRARDYFLLQFYFGGCDFTDLYFLKKIHYRKGRVYFDRGKTQVMVDLAVHPKAKVIIERYAVVDGEYLLPGGKSSQQYINYRRRYQRWLQELQTRQNDKAKNDNVQPRIDVLPDGGNLGIKVARHTFGNSAKKLMLEEAMIRELMGHANEGVDVWYKDRYPEKMRDEALFKIIDSE